jgi:hypothetical protein
MKRRKSKKVRTPKKAKKEGEKFQEKFQNFLIERETELNVTFNQSVKDISPIYYQYNLKDVATAIFISSLWLPNISSLVKHQLLTAILVSSKPNEFTNSKAINSYSEFKEFLEQVYALLPQFPMMEDYIPELDWGNIKFYHEENIYRIFYGQDLSNVYDYLILFQMLYLPFDNEYYNSSGRSPKKELTLCLRLQDAIILNIDCQPKLEDISELSPGHIEVPSVAFWENAKQFYNEYDVSQIFDEINIKQYSIEVGTLPYEQLDCNKFQEMAHTGKIVPKYFITYDGQYLPILPRRYSEILFDSWAKLFDDYHKDVVKDISLYTLRMSAALYKYISARTKFDFFEPAVSAITKEGKPHKIIFSSVFISKNRLILIYLTNPYYSLEVTQKELEAISDDLNEAIKLIKIPPHTLALHIERQNIQLKSNLDEAFLVPELIVVIPQTDTSLSALSYPATFPGRIMFMDAFLGIVDELDNKDTFSLFLEYMEEYCEKIGISFLSPLDIFGSFKDSYGVLLEGAVDYNMVVLDPHWGSNFRYKTLSEFWSIYPQKHFFAHPRSWRLKKETDTRIRLDARGYLGSALYCKIGLNHVFINAPFDQMTYEQCMISNMMMECLEDRMSKNIDIITRHRYFRSKGEFQVLFFPLSLVSSNKKYDHLKHLIPSDEEKWRSDIQMFMPGLYGIRTVFNDKLLFNALKTANDSSIEVDLLLEIIDRINNHIPDENVGQILEFFEQQKKESPRFKLMKASNKASFPQFISPCKPQIVDFKKARKRISELAKHNGFNEGFYSLEDAKVMIDKIKRSIIEEIDKEVSQYNFLTSIPFLLQIEKSLEHEVDFDRAEHYSKDETEYIGMHKNYKYLLEKFVQLQPGGTKGINKDQFQYLIALIDWLHVLYSASDSLWYGLDSAVGMKVSSQYLVEIEYDKIFSEKQKIFSEERAREKLGVGINLNDNVESSRTLTDFISSLDLAFKEDLGFTFSNMITLLKVLSFWPEFCENCQSAKY